jgi:hypothetical protein
MKSGRVVIYPRKVNVLRSFDVLMFGTSWHCRTIGSQKPRTKFSPTRCRWQERGEGESTFGDFENR